MGRAGQGTTFQAQDDEKEEVGEEEKEQEEQAEKGDGLEASLRAL